MQDPEGDADRLRAEAVAMLSEQAALCRDDDPAAAAPAPAPPAAAPVDPGREPGADTAALLRELRSLGEEQQAPPAGPPAPVPARPVVRVRRGVFRRHRPDPA